MVRNPQEDPKVGGVICQYQELTRFQIEPQYLIVAMTKITTLSIIVMCVTANLITGCTQEKGHANSLATALGSTNLTLQQKVDAVNRLVPQGTKGSMVESMLGSNCVWVHCHGLLLNLSTNDGSKADSMRYYDMWQLTDIRII